MSRFKSLPKKNIPIELSLEKARELSAGFRNLAAQGIPLAPVEYEPPKPPHVLVDAVSLGGPADGKSKPLVRHVIVKDLHKIAERLKHKMPKNGLFGNRAPMGLYALFDGWSCAGDPGPMAAEFCARNFHIKLLERLSTLIDTADANAVIAALKLAFEDLDKEMISNHPEIQDGCGAAVALLIGDHILTALLGQCSAVLCKLEDSQLKPMPLSYGGKGPSEHDVRRLKNADPSIVVEDASGVQIRHPSGRLSQVSRSLGDVTWKDGTGASGPLVSCTPEVRGVPLQGPDKHPSLFLTSSAANRGLGPQEMVDIATDFPLQPRAACGEVVTRAFSACGSGAQCTSVEVCFLVADHQQASTGSQQPAAKKPKLSGGASGSGTQSMRLRHILVKCVEGKDASGPKPDKAASTRQEAESILRKAILDMRREIRELKKTPKDATELVSMTTQKFSELCRTLSMCETASRGGNLCGELGWLTPDDRKAYGDGFREVIDVLLPGQLSDIAVSNHGFHLVQRMA